MKTSFKQSALGASTSVVVCLAATLVRGEIGPAMTGLSGNANDATTVFSSPAGMTRLNESEVVVQTIFAYTDSEFGVDSSTFSGGDGHNDQSLAIIPGIFYVRPLNEKWWFGASLNVPSGIGFDYGGDWAGRYHAAKTELAFVASSAMVAYKVNDKLSLAAGPYLMYTDSKTTTRVNNVGPSARDGSVEIEETGADVGYSVGAMYQMSDSARVAASYRSELQPDLDGTPTFYNVDPVLREALAAVNLLGTEVEVDFTVPAIAQCGFYKDLSDQWSMTGDLMWIDMSRFGVTRLSVEQESISVDSKFKDIWLTSVGAKYRYGDDRAVSVGGLYVSSSTSNGDRTIALPFDRVIGGGIGYEMPVKTYFMHMNLNFFDLGDAEVTEEGGPLSGDFSGSFARNYAVMLDFQFKF